MIFRVRVSDRAYADLNIIYSYIAETLKSESAAKKLIGHITFKIKSLNDMPERCARYNREPWYSKGIRFLPVGNYIILFSVDKDNQTIEILTIVYKRQNTDTLWDPIRGHR